MRGGRYLVSSPATCLFVHVIAVTTTSTILMLIVLLTVEVVLIELLLLVLLLLGGFIHRLLLQNVLGVGLGVAHRALLLLLLLLLHAGDCLRQIIQMLFV